MRLLPGYLTTSSAVKSLPRHSPVTQVAIAMYVDAIAFQLVPAIAAITANARPATDLIRARTAIELYSSVYRINEQFTQTLDVFG
jgi:hypothetical protein